MFSEKWSLCKYVELKRSNKEATNNLFLTLEKNTKALIVLSDGIEIDRVFYHMESSRYPFFKMKGDSFYVHFNPAGQGFRVKFISTEERTSFFKTMCGLTFISESPAKSLTHSEDSVEFDKLLSGKKTPTSNAKRSLLSSKGALSQSTCSLSMDSYRSGNCFSQPTTRPLSTSHSFHTQSQPVSTPRFDWVSNDSPYKDDWIDNMSYISSHTSFSELTSPQSHFSSQTASISDSQRSHDPFTPPTGPSKNDKACQTDSSLNVFNNDPKAMMDMVKKMMSDPEFIKLVTSARQSINEMPESEKIEMKEKLGFEGGKKKQLEFPRNFLVDMKPEIKPVPNVVETNEIMCDESQSSNSKRLNNDEVNSNSSKKPRFKQLTDKFSVSQI